MEKRQLIYVIASLIGVIAILGGLWLAYRQGWVAPQVPEGQVANPSVAGILVSVEGERVTVAFQDGSQKRYTLTPESKVISQVKTGEVGLSLAQFPQQAQVLVQTKSKYSSVIDSIALMTVPRVDTAQAGPPFAWRGSVTAVAADSIAVSTDKGQVSIRVPSGTTVVANVLAGQPGKSLADVQLGTYVIVNGYSVMEGPTAGTIQVIQPLQ